MTTQDLKALCITMYNVAPLRIATNVYGRHHVGAYLEAKAAQIQKNPVYWMGTLDETSLGNLCRFVRDYASGYFQEDDNV